MAIRLISLLRTQLKSDLAIYGATYSGKLNEYESLFLERSDVDLPSKAWLIAAGLDTSWRRWQWRWRQWRKRRRKAPAEKSPQIKPQNVTDTSTAATEPTRRNGISDAAESRSYPRSRHISPNPSLDTEKEVRLWIPIPRHVRSSARFWMRFDRHTVCSTPARWHHKTLALFGLAAARDLVGSPSSRAGPEGGDSLRLQAEFGRGGVRVSRGGGQRVGENSAVET